LEGNKPFNKPKYSKVGQKLEENASQVNKIQLDREDLSYPKTNNILFNELYESCEKSGEKLTKNILLLR
jgi:hypothetical protein